MSAAPAAPMSPGYGYPQPDPSMQSPQYYQPQQQVVMDPAYQQQVVIDPAYQQQLAAQQAAQQQVVIDPAYQQQLAAQQAAQQLAAQQQAAYQQQLAAQQAAQQQAAYQQQLAAQQAAAQTAVTVKVNTTGKKHSSHSKESKKKDGWRYDFIMNIFIFIVGLVVLM